MKEGKKSRKKDRTKERKKGRDTERKKARTEESKQHIIKLQKEWKNEIPEAINQGMKERKNDGQNNELIQICSICVCTEQQAPRRAQFFCHDGHS